MIKRESGIIKRETGVTSNQWLAEPKLVPEWRIVELGNFKSWLLIHLDIITGRNNHKRFQSQVYYLPRMHDLVRYEGVFIFEFDLEHSVLRTQKYQLEDLRWLQEYSNCAPNSFLASGGFEKGISWFLMDSRWC